MFIDEIHTLVGAGGEGAMDAANILKPALARRTEGRGCHYIERIPEIFEKIRSWNVVSRK